MAEFSFDLPPLRTDEEKPGTKDYAIYEWCEDRLRQGQRFVEASVGYDRIQPAIDSIFANENSSNSSYNPLSKPLSKTKANLTAKTAEDITALLTDTRIFWNYSTRNQKYENQATIANKMAEDWYTSRLIDLRIGDVIRYYTVAGTGIAHLYYSRRLNDMLVEAIDPRHVFPIEPISYHTFQDALGVIVRKPRTPNWVAAEYGKNVKADLGETGIFGWLSRMGNVGSMGRRSEGPLSKRRGDDQGIPATPTVFVNTCYLDDKRLNEIKHTVRMGKWDGDTPLTRWSYTVGPGMPLYPFKRMIVWGGGAILYDGPSPYWHAQYPVIKLTLNPWPMSWLGKAPLWDVMPLVDSLNSLLRVIDDHAAQLAQPGTIADRNVSKGELERFNSRQAGYKIRSNMASGKGIQVVAPPPLDQSLWGHVNWILEMIQKLSGTADISQMAQLAQIPSDDTIDTIMKAMTPGIRLRSRILEGFMKEFAEQYLYSIVEFDTLSKRIAKFGPQGVSTEDFDFDPHTFIPDDVPDGDPGDIASTVDALSADGPRPLYVRAKQMLQSFTYSYKPGSLLNSAAQQDRMEDMILAKMGYLSAFTLMEHLGRMNFAPPSLQVPNDELGRLVMQQQMGLGMVANAQGRKATDQAPPKLSTNGSGDPTITTS